MNDESNIFLWKNFTQHPPAVQSQMLTEIESMLPDLTAKQQADSFQGAPSEIILRFLPLLCDESQVRVYRDYLAVGRRKDAKLSYEARKKLGLIKRTRCLA